ncbi:MAG: DNA sulfur modification protein DndB, partial [Verrucomicrobiae bacterium]|nr:DNA sulfur modification protein DndB [Verrucomicrobiae bacterium]
MARYVVENPDSYIFSALTASVNAEVRFESLAGGSGAAERVGTLTIPMSATFVINDGQHRRAAIQQALAENPALGDETIAIVMFIDVGLQRCQQMFADLNRYAVRPPPSIGVLYDHRDPMAELTRQVVNSNAFLRDATDMENSSLSRRSRKLFTLSAMHTANASLLEGIHEDEFESRV